MKIGQEIDAIYCLAKLWEIRKRGWGGESIQMGGGKIQAWRRKQKWHQQIKGTEADEEGTSTIRCTKSIESTIEYSGRRILREWMGKGMLRGTGEMRGVSMEKHVRGEYNWRGNKEKYVRMISM